MASFHKSLCIFFFVFFTVLSNAYNFNVGGKDGWTLHPSESYSHWSSRLRFVVNDNLHFKYDSGSDSVLEVSKGDYESCNTNSPITTLTGGDSTFSLNRPGPFYFITGNKSNCDQGQKLTVVVITPKTKKTTPAAPPTPAGSSPVSSPPGQSTPTSPGAPTSGPSTSPAAPTSSPSSPGGGGSSAPIGSPSTSPGGSGSLSPPTGSPSTSPGGGGSFSPNGGPVASPSGAAAAPGEGSLSSPTSGPAASPSGSVSSSPTGGPTGSPGTNPADSPGGMTSSPTGNPADTNGNGGGPQSAASRPAVGGILSVAVAVIIFGLAWIN